MPNIAPSSYIHPTASIIGDVTIGEECYIGPGASIRGDYGTVVIGDSTAVEDNVVIHARPGEMCTIGNSVTLGHGCVVHNAVIHDHAIIGMGAVVSDYAEIGEWAVVAEGAVVKNSQKIPPRALAYGVPAAIREGHIGNEYMKKWSEYKEIYARLCEKYKSVLEEIR